MVLTLPMPASLHSKHAAREHFLNACQAALNWAPLERRLWRVDVTLYGNWFKADGTPTEANTDNIIKPLLDALADAGGLGKNGRGDCWLDRHLTVCALNGAPSCVVTLI